VHENIDRAIGFAEKLADDTIRPIFLEAYFRGMEEALKKKNESKIYRLNPS